METTHPSIEKLFLTALVHSTASDNFGVCVERGQLGGYQPERQPRHQGQGRQRVPRPRRTGNKPEDKFLFSFFKLLLQRLFFLAHEAL